jgi:hypothetical protein
MDMEQVRRRCQVPEDFSTLPAFQAPVNGDDRVRPRDGVRVWRAQ